MNLFKKTKNRIYLKNLINIIFISLNIALLLGLLLSILSRFIPIYKPSIKILIIIVISLILGFIIFYIKRPNEHLVALMIDSYGLEERITTALELRGKEDEVSKLQREDALKSLEAFEYKKKIHLLENKIFLLSLTCLAISVLVFNLVPNRMDRIAENIHKENIKKQSVLKKVDKLTKKINENKEMKKVDKKRIDKMLQKLKQDIKMAKNKQAIKNLLKKNLDKVSVMRAQYSKLAQNSLKNGKGKAELSKLKAISSLKDIEKELGGSQENANRSGDKQKLALDENEKNDNGDSKAANSQGNGTKGEGEGFSSGNGNSEGGAGDQGGFVSSQGGNGKSGSGSGNGAGGNGQGGSGAGEGRGKGNGSTKAVGESKKTSYSGIGKKATDEKDVKNYEKVFSPTKLGGTASNSNLKGQKSKSGDEKTIKTYMNGTKGTDVPYQKVIGEYKKQAYDSIEQGDVPESMKETVKNYFTAIDN